MSEDFASFVLRARGMGGPIDPILRAVEEVDRRRFVERDYVSRAYSNDVLPLPCGQATDRLDDLVRLTSTLAVEPHHRVLEIGGGGGFMTAILATLADRVTTLERYRTLLDMARDRCVERGIRNVEYRQADGTRLERLEGVYDRIVSSVTFRELPDGLLTRLAPNGVAVLPVGEGEASIMHLTKVGARFERTEAGRGWFPPVESGVALAI